MILFAAADLIWATRIKGVADALDVPARPARDLGMLEARLADCEVCGMVVDLDKEADAIELIRRLRDPRATPAERAIRIVAFGPHVRRDLLQQARDAGADEVMTRGAFDHGLDVILLRLAGRADA
ncbi:MAG: hypothetical protein WCK33_10550 [Phycisphaerae bacterium]|jgi:CheY-like chemotaxis protein